MTRSFAAFVPLALALSAAGWWTVRELRSTHEARVAAAQEAVLLREAASIRWTLGSLDGEAETLAAMAGSVLASHVDPAPTRPRLERLLVAYAQGKPSCRSVWFVDGSARDVVRVDRDASGPSLVPPEELSATALRPLVERALRAGSVARGRSTSTDDTTPDLWLAAPVPVSGRGHAGVVVLRLDVRPLLALVQGADEGLPDELLLARGDGSWLVAPAAPDPRVERLIPKLVSSHFGAGWEEEDLTLRSEQGLFTLHAVHHGGGRTDGALAAEEEPWVLVAHIPPEGLIPPWWRWIGPAGGIGLLGLALIVVLVTAIVLRRRQDATAAREDEERLRRVTSTIRDAIVMLDSEGRVRFWNPAATELLGYDEAEALGQDFHALVATEEERRRAQRGLAGFRESGTGPLIGRLQRVRARRKDGSTFTAELSVAAVHHRDAWWAVGSMRDTTFREVAERALQESDRRMREMLETVQLVAIMLDTDGAVLYANHYAQRLLGWSEAELLGQDWCTLVHDDPDPIRQAIRAAIRSGALLPRIETKLRTRGGEERDVVFSNTLLRATDGTPVGLTSIGLDVTEARRVEQTARLLQRFAASTRTGLTIVDARAPGMPVVDCNAAYEAMTGLGRDEIVGRPWRALLPDDADEGGLAALGAAVEKGGEGHAELLTHRSDGTPIWMEATVSPVLDGEGLATHFVSVLTDVTDRKAAEQELVRHRDHLEELVRERTSELLRANECLEQEIAERRRADEALSRSERRLSAAQHLAGLGSWEYDLRGGRITWSVESYRIHGRAIEEGPPTREEYLASILPEDRAAFDAAIASLRHREVSPRVLVRHQRPDGTIVHVLGQAQRVTEDGRLTAIWGSALDVTESQLAAQELTEAHRAAQAASRAKSEFLATMSHEIRSPLHALVGFVELTLGTALTASQREYLEAARSSGWSLSALVDELLDFSKVEAGRTELAAEPMDVRGLVHELVATYRPKSVAKGVELVTDVDGDVPARLVADRQRLRQVLVNLLTNAFKFTERGEVVLRVSVIGGVADRISLRFSVRDTGIGIPADLHDRLFQPFVQADSSVTRRYGGTGLGLAISQRLVTLMGGSLAFQSTEGQGAEFFFTVPLRAAQAQADPARPAPASCATSEGPGVPAGPERPTAARGDEAATERLRGRRVLLAEDNATNQLLATALLSSWGVEAEVAHDGEEAVRLVRDRGGSYAAVLMDVQMPRVDGLTATRRIRALAGGSEIPIIAMTANAMGGDREACFDAGMDDYLSKPIDAARMREVLARLVRDPEAAPALALPGVDVAQALARLGVGEAVLRQLLRRFRDADRGAPARIREALGAGDRGAATRLAHAVKGAAGTLGASALQRAAEELEGGLRSGAADLGLFLRGFEAAAEQLFTGLDSLGS